MKVSLEFYAFISKLTFSDIGRGLEVPELKERMRNLFMKIKAISEERCFYIKSLIDNFDKALKEFIAQEQENEKLKKEMKEKEAA
jgi:cell shape-determining protein MreC